MAGQDSSDVNDVFLLFRMRRTGVFKLRIRMAAVTAPSWGAAHEALRAALYDGGSFNRAAGASEAQKFVDTAPRGAVNAARAR